MLKVCLGALAGALFACASVPYQPPHYYLTETALTIHTPRADSVRVHIEERLELQLNETLHLGRRDVMEQAACGHIERTSSDHREFWMDSLSRAWVVGASATQVVFTCPANTVPMHWHVVFQWQGYDQCVPSPLDTSPGWSKYPFEVLICGVGPDSVVAWKARP